MTDQITPAGTTSVANIYGRVIDYLKSINLPFMLTDYGIKMSVNNIVVDMYIYNATWVLHIIINNERNSLSSDMYVKQTQDNCGTYLVSYEREKTKVWVKMKLSGNEIYDVAVPFIAITRAVELIGKQISFMLPQSLQ